MFIIPVQYSAGRVNSINDNRFYYDAHTRGGSSGAPVIDYFKSNPKVVGVHVAGNELTLANNCAVPIYQILLDAKASNQNWVLLLSAAIVDACYDNGW